MWTWKLLWTRDTTHLKYNILDAVIREGNSISSWIFTTTDGLVKSKSNFRWNSANIIERCTKDDMKTVSGHEYVEGVWRSIAVEDMELVRKNSPAIIIMGRINFPSFFIEQLYSLEPGEMLAKHVTYRLCPDTVKGPGTLPSIGGTVNSISAPFSDDLPSYRLRNKDKKLNKLGEEKVKELVHLVESRAKVVVKKFTVVYLVEVARNGTEASSSNMQLWLHHVSAISADKKGRGGEVSCGSSVKGSVRGWETRSETSATIAPTSVSGHMRGGTMRCAGDFCGFIDEEEASMHATDEGSVAEEARLALKRHRRLTKAEQNEDSALLKSSAGEDAAEDKASLHRQYGAGVLIGSQAFKIPQKTIVLVRKDMEKLEGLGDNDLLDPSLTDRVPWPMLVQHWWWRVGKTIMEGKARRVIIPESSSHQIYDAIWNRSTISGTNNSESIEEVLSMDPRARLKRIANDLSSSGPSSSASAGERLSGTDKLSAKNLGKLTTESSVECRPIRERELIKSMNVKESNSKMGDLSWYYSEANVCERCYHVYREIERKRKMTIKEKAIKSHVNPYDTMYAELPSQAQEALRTVPLSERDRYLEARKQNFIRRQRSNADRLAQAKVDNIEDESRYEMDMSTLGPHDSSSQHRPKKYTSPAGAPRRVIPPAPWNLHDQSVRSEYEEMGSAFIKNIRNKAQSISNQVKEDQKLREMERQMGIDGATELSDSFDWKVVTGQRNGRRKSKFTQEEELGPSPLHKSMSAGDIIRTRKKKHEKREVKLVTKHFDSSRLMHKWQRDMEAERIQRRQEDEIWKNDSELTDRLQRYQNTGIVQGVAPMQNKKTKKPKNNFNAPTVPPNSILNQRSIVQEKPPLDDIFRSTVTLSNAELGLMRKNSLHTITEDDDDPSSPPLNHINISHNKPNQSKSPIKQPSNSKPVSFNKGPAITSVAAAATIKADQGDEGDDDDDDGIGWSPFVVPLG